MSDISPSVQLTRRCDAARRNAMMEPRAGRQGPATNGGAMEEGTRSMRLAIAGYERVMERTDMRASVLTLAAGECVSA